MCEQHGPGPGCDDDGRPAPAKTWASPIPRLAPALDQRVDPEAEADPGHGCPPISKTVTAQNRPSAIRFAEPRMRSMRPGGSTRSDRHRARTASRWRSSFSSLGQNLRQPSDHLVLIAAREHPGPQRLTDLRPVPLHTAAHHLEPAHPARIQAELTAHVVDRSRRDLAGMPRKAALDLEETSPSTLSSTASPRACWPTAPGRRRPASTTRPDHPVPTHGARHDPGRARFQHRPPTNAASIRWPASPRRRHTTRRSATRRWVRYEAPIMVCIDLDETGHIGTVVVVG